MAPRLAFMVLHFVGKMYAYRSQSEFGHCLLYVNAKFLKFCNISSTSDSDIHFIFRGK